jgi:hypothetical protein
MTYFGQDTVGSSSNNMSNTNLRVAILVVSTTASKDPSADLSAAILKDVFDKEGGGKWKVSDVQIVGDEVLDIQRTILAWTDGGNPVNVIITTGGTGFAIHDNTPEVGHDLSWFREHALWIYRPSLLSCTNKHPDLCMACLLPH